ncbi:MAG: DUF1697 domain-containing protein [Planctomycetes bacterium]|nr:DUF1697 domain-containing protein [Planctomycetota bacterium]
MTAEVQVFLLRAINVGGRNKLPMAWLIALFEELGCPGARTYIQSGNVIARVEAGLARRLPALIGAAIEERLGFRVPVIRRSGRELERLVAGNPFLIEGRDPAELHLSFLGAAPAAAARARLAEDWRLAGDYRLARQDLYLALPDGVAGSGLDNAWLERRLGVEATTRNWRTCLALLRMAGEI